MHNIDSCITNLKNFYANSSENEQSIIVNILQKLSQAAEVNAISDISLTLDGIHNVTKLPNRESLLCDISVLKEDAMLIYFHIDQIGAIKELYGIDLVNKIIKDKAEHLVRVMSHNDVEIYNINIQRFAVLVKKETLFEKYMAILKYSIFNDVDKDTYITDDGKSIVSDYTVGISYGDDHLFHRANVALQEAILSKEKYKVHMICNNIKELQQTSLDRLRVYKSALHNGNILPYFQPIVDAKTGSIIKYEALARLKTEDGKIVSPYEFLNSAIEDKTFEFFTRQMMQKVFNVFEKTDSHISLNLTYDNLSSPTMMDYIRNRLDKYGGDGITFEIVETEEIKNYEVVENFILMAKSYDAKVSIDDFGSGYSNFTNIIKLNIDFIKIDGTLITKLHDDDKVKTMVRGLIQFARSINVKTIAEFVSSKEIADEVSSLGVDYIQGYYYGEPKPPQDYGII